MLTVVAVALALAAPAGASNVGTPRMTEVASWAAGKPVAVHCENDPEAWQKMVAAAGLSDADGFTYYAEPKIYLSPVACANLAHPGAQLGLGLSTLLHEAYTHRGTGVRDEAIQECAARVLIYSALHEFYGVPWWSDRMRVTVELALARSLSLPPAYQNGCSKLRG